MDKEVVKRKIGVAFVYDYMYANGIARFLTVLTDLLAETGKYKVYLINEGETDIDFKINRKVKRIITKIDTKQMIDVDQENNIDIYILNNDATKDFIDTYRSLGKKVIGIFHGVYLSCIFTNDTDAYPIWGEFNYFDSFVHIIPDDYWIYKKFGFNNTIYIPNIYTFDSSKVPTSPLTNKNILMVGRVDDIIKGGKFGILAMSEIVKVIPDAKLTIVGLNPPDDLINLTYDLHIEKNVIWANFSLNISEYYLNTSVLLVTSVSESFPMVMNEGKAHSVPVVSFNVDYSPCFQKGVITVEMFDYLAMAKETIKLLNDFEYRKEMGKIAKESLKMYNNNDTINMWGKLFNALVNGNDEYGKLQKEVENKYYNETIAKERLIKHFHYGQQFNNFFKCHSFENFTSLDYIKTITVCPNETKSSQKKFKK
jgi:glycosyltransferase involved in cell wall biosynthesis